MPFDQLLLAVVNCLSSRLCVCVCISVCGVWFRQDGKKTSRVNSKSNFFLQIPLERFLETGYLS